MATSEFSKPKISRQEANTLVSAIQELMDRSTSVALSRLEPRQSELNAAQIETLSSDLNKYLWERLEEVYEIAPADVPPQPDRGSRLVFISHAREDSWLARRIAEQIQSAGAATFLAQDDINIGADFLQRILEGLNRADELLVLLTPWSISRPFVSVEVGAALTRGILLIGVLSGFTLEEFHAQSNIPGISNMNLINLNQLDQYMSILRTRVVESE